MSRELYEKIAKRYGTTLAPNDLPDMIIGGLEHNLKEHGAKYCPCMLERNKDTICPCLVFRKKGHCHCGLYVDYKPDPIH